MDSRDEESDAAFADVAVRKGLLKKELADRVLEFARLKRRPVAALVTELGVLPEARVAKIERTVRYKLARAEDRRFAQAAVREGLITKEEAIETLTRQRELFRAGRGFLRFLALLRVEGKLSQKQDRRIRRRAARSKPSHAAFAALAPDEGTEISAPPLASHTPSGRRVIPPARPSGSGSGDSYGRVRSAFA